MGELIRFRPRQEVDRPPRMRPLAGTPEDGGAQILLFMGVRYERHAEAGPSERKGQSRRGRPKKRA